jgi:hypothetical protein
MNPNVRGICGPILRMARHCTYNTRRPAGTNASVNERVASRKDHGVKSKV